MHRPGSGSPAGSPAGHTFPPFESTQVVCPGAKTWEAQSPREAPGRHTECVSPMSPQEKRETQNNFKGAEERMMGYLPAPEEKSKCMPHYMDISRWPTPKSD